MTTVKKHPLEDVFGMHNGTMDFSYQMDNDVVEYEAPPVLAPAPAHEDDAEDKDIDKDIKRVFDTAMRAYEDQTGMVETVDPRYAARTAEVANGYLNTALSAVALRAKTKADKRKTNAAFIPYQNNVSGNNIIMADRNSLLEALAEKKKLGNS